MKIQEAYDAVKLKFPGRPVEAWEWISDDGDHTQGVKLDGQGWFKATFEEAITGMNAKTNEQIAKGKRDQAAKLQAEADMLDPQPEKAGAAQ